MCDKVAHQVHPPPAHTSHCLPPPLLAPSRSLARSVCCQSKWLRWSYRKLATWDPQLSCCRCRCSMCSMWHRLRCSWLQNNGYLMESMADDASELLELLLLRGDNGRQNTIEIHALFVLGAEPAKRLSLVKGVLTALPLRLTPLPPPRFQGWAAIRIAFN